MDKKNNRITHLEFLSGPNAGQHHYFGSISAIFEKFDDSMIRIKEKSLWDFGITPENPYQNKVCIIRRGELIRKEQNCLKRELK